MRSTQTFQHGHCFLTNNNVGSHLWESSSFVSPTSIAFVKMTLKRTMNTRNLELLYAQQHSQPSVYLPK
jgi:hypothetical protein